MDKEVIQRTETNLKNAMNSLEYVLFTLNEMIDIRVTQIRGNMPLKFYRYAEQGIRFDQLKTTLIPLTCSLKHRLQWYKNAAGESSKSKLIGDVNDLIDQSDSFEGELDDVIIG